MNVMRSREAVLMLSVGLFAGGCAGGSDETAGDTAGAPAAESAAGGGTATPSAEFSEADLDALARGLARETELVREAQARAATAATPEARAEAAQAQWEDQTIAGGAEAAGMSRDRYAAVREAVTHTLETLDFQGRIDGPMQMDTARASPDMRRRLEGDAYEGLPAGSAAALRAKLDQLVPVWVSYVELVAVAG